MKNKTTKSLIDTSKMSAGERAALEATEAARESQFDDRSSFPAGYFMGRPDFARVDPFPEQSIEDRDQGDAFLSRLWGVLSEADPDEIDASGEIPEATISLRQGVGRLIRDTGDRGIVALCDNRLNTKGYGRGMLDSLPPMRRSSDLDEVKAFARQLEAVAKVP